MWKTVCILTLLFSSLPVSVRTYSQQKAKPPNDVPELVPRRPECGLFLPAHDERHDLARLVRADEFLTCERTGFPPNLAPPWKTSDEGMKKLGDACEVYSRKSANEYPQVGRADLTLAADRCRIEVLQIILSGIVQNVGQEPKPTTP